MKYIKSILFKIQFYLPHTLLRFIKRKKQINDLKSWKNNNYPAPPPHLIKVILLKYIAKKKNINIFIETGAFMGDMLDEMKNSFKEIHSIELFEPLYKRVTKIFKKNKNINIHLGDSAIIMPNLLNKINQSTLFWLDAHYSGSGTGQAHLDTPIEKELVVISKIKSNHVIVIDDARLFNGQDDYPKLSKLKKKYQSTYTINVIHDMIVLVK